MKRSIHLLILALVSLCQFEASAEPERITIAQFLTEVRATSLQFAVEKANVEASQARANGIRINPPMIGYMQMKDASGTNHGFEIAQEIPFPTKIVQEKKVRDLDLETQKESRRLQEVAVLTDARSAYVAFWSAYERLAIQKEKHRWLQHHSKITRTTAWSDTAAKIHLLEVESDADLVQNDVLSLDADLTENRNRLKSYAPNLNVENLIPAEPSLIPLKREKQGNTSVLALREKELSSIEAVESLKKLAYVPDFYVRLRSYNGNELVQRSQELMVGINIPFLYFSRPRAEIAEASAQRTRAAAELQKSRVDLNSSLSSLLARAESTELQIKNLKEKLIPRSERQMNLVRNLSQRTMEGLDQHKRVMLSLLDLRMKAIELRVQHEDLAGRLRKLTGLTEEEEGSK